MTSNNEAEIFTAPYIGESTKTPSDVLKITTVGEDQANTADQSYGKFNETLDAGIALRNITTNIIDTAYAASWDGDTTHAPSNNAVYDKLESMTTTIDTKITASDLFLLMGA